MRPREYHLFEGEPVTVSVPDPGGGVQFVYNLLPDYIYLLNGVEYFFDTGGLAGTRYHRLFYNTTSLSQHWGLNHGQGSGTVRRVHWGIRAGTGGFGQGDMAQGSLPDRWYLIGGSVESAILNLVGADAVTDITLNFVRWADI